MTDDDEGTAWDGPLVVLIDKLSASASEIFAGVIKDYGRGLIIGDSSTFGKGTVQSIVQINDHTRRRDRKNLRRSQADDPAVLPGQRREHSDQWRRPRRPSFPRSATTCDLGEGKMDNALKFDKVARLPHDNYNRVPPTWSTLLNERSAERRKADPKFQKQDERIKKFLDRKARHSISLNEAKFKAEYAPDDDPEHADEEKTKNDKKKKKFIEREVWATDFYNDEVVRIVADYLTLGSKVLAANPIRAAVANP